MKNYRHQKIMEIIHERCVETQEDLADLLNEAGFPVTQATISRDIKQLRLHKVPTADGKQKYAVGSEGEKQEVNERLVRVFRDGYVSMDVAMNILVVRTVSGMAMAVAAAIDSMNLSQIVGSIAGDDTIMCAIRSVEEAYEVMDELRRIIGKTK